MTPIPPLSDCPTCGSGDSHPVVVLEDVPVLCNRLYEEPEAAAGAEHAPVDLHVCAGCATTWNRAFEPERVAYEPGYENSLYGSPTFRRYSDRLVERLTTTHDLGDRPVVEIGCGDARFLIDLCARSGAPGIGLDPSYGGPRHPAPGVVVHRTGALPEDVVPALVAFRHVLEHVAEPVDFLRRAADIAGDDAVLYCEVPDASSMFADSGVWDVIYEHPLYLTRASLTLALERADLRVTRAVSDYDGQFLCVDAVRAGSGAGGPPTEGPSPADPSPDPTPDVEAARRFGRRARRTIEVWQERLEGWHREGRRVALWGMGSKGTTFLSLVPATGRLSHLVDVNPDKQGRHPPGSPLPVSPPGELREEPPDVVVVANPTYLEEISGSLDELGLGARCVPLWGADAPVPG